jgi:hypothetical protein
MSDIFEARWQSICSGLKATIPNHRLARKIQIIPANMVWDDGNMVVQPKASLKKGSQEKPTKSVTPSSIINKSQKQPAGEKNTAFDSALMALFLASVSEKRITN